ncbi:MAG: lipopolysaccharide kinase InaA family protein [Azoarcus sp.]|jgi:tRNA A-37 threonylcarbamoyl transferase component Bud32|nr:lipopolysaccharide kinase InaA family protein [Azoarcus sp.]
MNDYIAAADRSVLEKHGLLDFEASWNAKIIAVDAPNLERGGWSEVGKLVLDGQAYYLKRQRNHLTRSLAHLFGEPTFAREFRYIQFCQARAIAVPSVAFHAQRKAGKRAILLTRALDGWSNLAAWLEDWPTFAREERDALLMACGVLARRLHDIGLMHGCFYPKHVFVRGRAPAVETCLIDLEKARPLWLGARDRVNDLEKFIRHAAVLSGGEVRLLLAAYAGERDAESPAVDVWLRRLRTRQRQKGGPQ